MKNYLAQYPLGQIAPKRTTGYQPTTDPAGSLSNVISNVLGFMTIIAAMGFLFYFFLGAINWITAAGDTNKSQTARLMITNALIGLTITIIAYPAISIISTLLGVPLTDPTELFTQLIF